MKQKVVAIVLSAGKGTRMGAEVAKQYLLVNDKPVLYYTLQAFEQSEVDEVVLVVSRGEEEYVTSNIVKKYGFQKVSKVIAGGKERYDSVYSGLQEIKEASYVLIHDGARPCLTVDLLSRLIREVKVKEACVAAVPVKDTIKVVNSSEEIVDTPLRDTLRMVQTPQAFSYPLIKRAYDLIMEQEHSFITDDAMVVEHVMSKRVYSVYGEYTNIKITTPEDLSIMRSFLEMQHRI